MYAELNDGSVIYGELYFVVSPPSMSKESKNNVYKYTESNFVEFFSSDDLGAYKVSEQILRRSYSGLRLVFIGKHLRPDEACPHFARG